MHPLCVFRYTFQVPYHHIRYSSSPLAWHRFIKWRHRNIYMSFINKFRHKPIEQCQKQCGNMCTVHIGIGHNNNLVIAKLCNIKIISISFRKSAAKCIDHRLDLRIGKHLVNTCLFNIQNLTSNRKDCLIITVSGCLCRTACGISLYDKDLTLGRISSLTVCQLSIGIKRILLFCQKIGLCLLFVLRIFAAFSAQERMSFNVSRLRSKYRDQSAHLQLPCQLPWLHPDYPALSLSVPQIAGAGCLIDTTAVIPLRISAPVKFASFSLEFRFLLHT